MSQGYFLPRGPKKVTAEMRLMVPSYSMKGALDIAGVDHLIRAMA